MINEILSKVNITVLKILLLLIKSMFDNIIDIIVNKTTENKRSIP